LIAEELFERQAKKLAPKTSTEIPGDSAHTFCLPLVASRSARFRPSTAYALKLTHIERDEVRGAYNRATRMAERKAMVQAWAD
jgi:hypothetical protein